MDDLISRQAAIDALAKAMPSLTTPDGCGQFDHDIYIAQETFVDSMQIIADLPSAERRGRWIDITKCGGYSVFKCSECGDLQLEESYYCPNCGAKMDGEEE